MRSASLNRSAPPNQVAKHSTVTFTYIQTLLSVAHPTRPETKCFGCVTGGSPRTRPPWFLSLSDHGYHGWSL